MIYIKYSSFYEIFAILAVVAKSPSTLLRVSDYDCHFGVKHNSYKGMTPMKALNASERTTERTSEQENNFRRLLRDIAEHAATVALSKVKTDRKGWQRIIESGNKLREAVTDAVISVVGEFSASRVQYVASAPVPASENIVLTEQLLKERYNIGWLGDNFRHLFLEKTLQVASAGAVAVHRLKEYSTNQQLKDELGGQAILPFARMLALVEKQRNGEAGSLLTNGYANLIFVEIEGGLWAVRARWRSDYGNWHVEADSVEDPDGWHGGSQILSRDS